MKVAKLKMNIGQALLLVLVTTEPFIYLFLIFYWSWLLYNAVLVSAVEHSDSAKHVHTPPLFWISFLFRSPQSIEQGSLCRTVDSCWLSLIYIIVYICQTLSPNPSRPLPFPLGVHRLVLYVCVSTLIPQISSVIPFFQIPYICINITIFAFLFLT